MPGSLQKILIANRGEIACRVIRTARRLGIATVAVYSDADAHALHVEMADEAVRLGPAPVAESYLRGDLVIEAAERTGADAIHPGYGFLSENPGFVEAVSAAGLVFIGPSAAAIRAMGLKDAAKTLMAEAGVPVVPGYQGEEQDPAFLAGEADKVGYPVLIKARAGGGGKGMRRVDRAADFADALASAQREGVSAFGDGHVLIEKFIGTPRHIEVQVFGDAQGNVVHLFERDCSLQRRHQKVIEEAPAPGMSDAMREAMTSAAVKAARAIGYQGAGTIEFIVDGAGALRPDGFWFMEMNTRLQVEHPVTEAVTGLDLVEWQIRVAAGEALPLQQHEIRLDGHAVEARLYAEDPVNGFLPATGRLHHVAFSGKARNDSGVRTGDTISPWYDPMIAKVIAAGEDRARALQALVDALQETHVVGATTNAAFLLALVQHAGFRAGRFDTGLIGRDIDTLIAPSVPSERHIAIAVVLALGLDRNAPTSRHRGWRLWGRASRRIALESGGEVFERVVRYGPDGRVELCGGEASLALRDIQRGSHGIRARLDACGTRLDADVASVTLAEGQRVSVLLDGSRFEALLRDPRIGSLSSETGGDSVAAPMSGVVIAVDVEPGDAVRAGQRLGVMEAMKMETALMAPRDGTISAVACRSGDAVDGGAVLFEYATDAA